MSHRVIVSAMSAAALDTDQAKTIGIVAIVAVVALGLLVSVIVTKIITRLVALVLAVVLGFVIWTQRADIESAAKKCDATFFGVHLTPSNPTLKARCQQLGN